MDAHDKVSQLRQSMAQKKENEKRAQEHASSENELSIGLEEKYQAEIADLKKQLEQIQTEKTELQSKAKEAYEKYLRTYAEMENYQKRAAKEKEDLRQYGTEKVFHELLPVLDSMEMALAHGNEEGNSQKLLEGVELVRKQLIQALEKFGLKPIPAAGKPFDPNVHEAVAQHESSQHEPDTVMAEHRKGYQLHQRVLRPAMVTVAKAPEASAKKASNEEIPIHKL